MGRVRSNDYDEKARIIMDNAAALFSLVGYAGAKLQDVAKACGATKSMLYHYFPTKDDLLFAILSEHLEQLYLDIAEISDGVGDPRSKIRHFVAVYVQKSAESRQRHVSAMNDIKYLPPAKRGPLIDLQRDVIRVSADLVRQLRPDLPPDLIKPYAMLLLGMLNWTDFWYDPTGPRSPDELCDRICAVFLDGMLAART